MIGRELRVAVVGLGYWGPNLVRAMSDVEDAQIHMLCDRDADRLAQQGRRYPHAILTREFDDVLNSEDIDVVLLTSLSVARELRRQVPRLHASVRVGSIGPGTTRDAERLGFRVAHTARSQSVDALLAELDALPDTPEASS